MSASKSKLVGRDMRADAIIAKSWAIGEKLAKNAKYIWKQDESMAIELFNGKAVTIVNDKGVEVTTSKITTVYAYLKRLEEKVPDVPEDYGWDANSYIATQAGKDWFYRIVPKVKDNSNEVNRLLAELANYKFCMDEEVDV